ncbi:MAG: methyltransferase domain-containing protein [Burkholderiales bacterium]
MRLIPSRRGAPDRAAAIGSCRPLAESYDASCKWLERPRRPAIELLGSREGETVIDVACGTGPMLPELARRVGLNGRVIGLEQSAEMLALARQRVRNESIGHTVILAEAPAEEFSCEERADAPLFFYAHDVLQSAAALSRLFAHARPGARVVVAGARFLPWWAAPLNLWTALRARRYLTTCRGLTRPWRRLERECPDFSPLASNFLGTGYLGAGTYRGPR